MIEYSLPHFGKIDLTSPDQYYEVIIIHKGHDVKIDLNFEKKTIEELEKSIIGDFITSIDELDTQNLKYINNDYEVGETVKDYLEYQLEELDEDEMGELIDAADRTATPEKQLLKKIRLIRIGFYPEHDEYFATFDYSLGEDFTNYLIVITANKNREINSITSES